MSIFEGIIDNLLWMNTKDALKYSILQKDTTQPVRKIMIINLYISVKYTNKKLNMQKNDAYYCLVNQLKLYDYDHGIECALNMVQISKVLDRKQYLKSQ